MGKARPAGRAPSKRSSDDIAKAKKAVAKGQRAKEEKGGRQKCERAKPVTAMPIRLEPHGHGEEVGRKDRRLRKKGDRDRLIGDRGQGRRKAPFLINYDA